jgi:membrane protein DedA with SNARE-associated domain
MLEDLIVRWGYLAIAVGTFFEGESILVVGGALAHQGLLSLPLTILVAFVGSVTGDQLWFQLGRRFGRPLLERRPAWKARAAAAQLRLERYGDAFVLGFRFVYGVRAITPALLGMSTYPLRRYAFLNVIGGAVWAVVVGSAGWACGAAVTSILKRAAHVQLMVLIGCAALFAGWVLWKILRRRAGTGPGATLADKPRVLAPTLTKDEKPV